MTLKTTLIMTALLAGGAAGYPVIGLLQRPTNDPRGIAPNVYPLGCFGVSCFGIPGDEDACADFDYTSADTGTTVDVFLFEDQDGPIYTLSDWIGGGFVPNFTLFIDNPGIGVNGDQFDFDLTNVDAAFATVDTYAEDGTITIEYVYEIDLPDADGDGVIDDLDNCINTANAGQIDTNGDGYGNVCDPDLNNDGIVNSIDLGLFAAAFFAPGVTDSDFNTDGITNAIDLGTLRAFFCGPPGPSGVAP